MKQVEFVPGEYCVAMDEANEVIYYAKARVITIRERDLDT